MNELALLNSLFDDFGSVACGLPSVNFKKVFASPKVDVKETKDSYTLEMDLPGKTEKDVDIELNGNVLTISSLQETKEEKKDEEKENGAKDETKWLIRERSTVEFKRSFTIPEDVDYEKLSAAVKNGVLTVTMPRRAVALPKKIAVTCA